MKGLDIEKIGHEILSNLNKKKFLTEEMILLGTMVKDTLTASKRDFKLINIEEPDGKWFGFSIEIDGKQVDFEGNGINYYIIDLFRSFSKKQKHCFISKYDLVNYLMNMIGGGK